jgi:PAS domain S-box-containing protein
MKTMTAKDKFIEQELTQSINNFTSSLLLIAGLFILFLGILDYLVTPENFPRFFLYRVIATSCYFLLFVAFKLVKKHANVFIICAAVIVSAMIEMMILAFGGHQSPYYAGMIVVFMFLFGLLPITFGTSLIIAGIIYLTYLVPILLFDAVTNYRIFINNNMFLLATIGGGLVWRYLNHKLLLKNLSLQFDLEQQKKHLEIYALQLESMVEDRTKELRKSNQWHQSLFESATDGIVVMNTDGIIVNANERACEMHGFTKDAIVGIHSSLLEVDENRHKAAERMRQILAGESLVYETTHFKKDGARVALEVSAKAIPIAEEVFVQAFLRDITEKKKIQEHLFQSQKMESIGMLAGGIAHDFNNILTAVIGYVAAIRKEVGANQKVLSKLSIIENASRKASRLVSQLLGFARKSEFEVVSFNVNDMISDTVRLAERLLDKRIELHINLAEALPSVEGDVNKLEQVLMNLVVNARDAMPYGGTITVGTSVIDAAPGTYGVPPYVKPGSYVELAVTDTGIGIPEAIQRKIFEPFFTTKERGKGSGLGLAMAYGIVLEHKGYLLVKSKVGEGTTFTILLPVSLQNAPRRKKQPLAPARGTETILLVDDDPTVIDAIKESLEMNGYKVLATTNPQSALDAFKRMHRDIALVITDVDMPMIDGRDLLREMMVISPAMRFLTVSAYGSHEDRGALDISGRFLQKPFEPGELLTTVRTILDRDKPSAFTEG